MRQECRALANNLLEIDNTLAFALCNFINKDYVKAKEGMYEAVIHAMLLQKQGIISLEELDTFTQLHSSVTRDFPEENMENVRRAFEIAHTAAEEILLNNVVECECGYQRG